MGNIWESVKPNRAPADESPDPNSGELEDDPASIAYQGGEPVRRQGAGPEGPEEDLTEKFPG